MKLFMVEGTFVKPAGDIPNFQKVLKGHHAFSQKGIQEGWIVMAGPKTSGGGYLILKAESEDGARAYMENDPFQREGVNLYTFKEFQYFNGQPRLEAFFK